MMDDAIQIFPHLAKDGARIPKEVINGNGCIPIEQAKKFLNLHFNRIPMRTFAGRKKAK